MQSELYFLSYQLNLCYLSFFILFKLADFSFNSVLAAWSCPDNTSLCFISCCIISLSFLSEIEDRAAVVFTLNELVSAAWDFVLFKLNVLNISFSFVAEYMLINSIGFWTSATVELFSFPPTKLPIFKLSIYLAIYHTFNWCFIISIFIWIWIFYTYSSYKWDVTD